MIFEGCVGCIRRLRRSRRFSLFVMLVICIFSFAAVIRLLLAVRPTIVGPLLEQFIGTDNGGSGSTLLADAASGGSADAGPKTYAVASLDVRQRALQFEFKLPVPDGLFCSNRFVTYGGEFARLRDVVVDRRYCRCDRFGGEKIENVLNQAESAEYYQTSLGCFRLDGCSGPSRGSGNGTSESGIAPLQAYLFTGNQNHLNEWKAGLRVTDSREKMATGNSVDSQESRARRREFTIAVKRYEYVNLYHTMTDWYNAYLLSVVHFGHTNPAVDVHILWVDAHPAGSLDSVWTRLFKSATRLSELSPTETYFDDLVWGWQGYRSPLYVREPSTSPPPLIDEFRDYFLSAYGIESRGRTANCADSDRPSVLFIWRHDYVAHPRNPSGRVMRKIGNEQQILKYVQKRFPMLRVAGVQIDSFEMSEQLQMIADTDILIGKSTRCDNIALCSF
jgi:hypothetical protein